MIPLMYILLRIHKVRFDGNTAAGHVGPVRVRGITVPQREHHRLGHKAKLFNDFPISDCFAALTRSENRRNSQTLNRWFWNRKTAGTLRQTSLLPAERMESVMKWGMNGLGLLMVLTLISAARAEPSGLLNDTGQTQCLNVTGTALEECTPENSGDDSPFPGQDGRYGRDAAAKYSAQSGFTKPEGSGGHGGFAFTPLNVNGNPIPLVGDPPVPAETPRCVWDRVTNLIWEVKTDDGGLQDKDWTYAWGFNPGTNCLFGYECNTNGYISSLAQFNPCEIEGSGKWRLPSRRELLSIYDHAKSSPPRVDASYFINTASKYYWSSTASTSAGRYWSVSFEGGDTLAADQLIKSIIAVRLVRSGPPTRPHDAGLIDNQDGTVTDLATGLQWDKCTWGFSGENCDAGLAWGYTWSQALKTSSEANKMNNNNGYKDWRLPNKNELESLVLVASSPSINKTYFPNTLPSYYWTSTIPTQLPSKAWYVNFEKGMTFYDTQSSGRLYYVRLVRDGNNSSDYDLLSNKLIFANIKAGNTDGIESNVTL